MSDEPVEDSEESPAIEDRLDPDERAEALQIYLIAMMVAWLDFRLSTATAIYKALSRGIDLTSEDDCFEFVEVIAKEIGAGDPPLWM